MRWEWLLSPFYGWRTWDPENLRNLPKVSQQIEESWLEPRHSDSGSYSLTQKLREPPWHDLLKVAELEVREDWIRPSSFQGWLPIILHHDASGPSQWTKADKQKDKDKSTQSTFSNMKADEKHPRMTDTQNIQIYEHDILYEEKTCPKHGCPE